MTSLGKNLAFRCLVFFYIVGLTTGCAWDKRITIYMIGDSTMADKPTPEANPERGWGQVFDRCFSEAVTVRNFAVNGRSTKSFIDEGKWDSVRAVLQVGDWVFIQFGHNDAKRTDPARFTNPYTGYRRNLTKFVRESREAGATPVLLSSIVRRKFTESGVLLDTHGSYPFVMRLVADELSVPFIDMQLKSEGLVAELGPEASKKLYLWVEPGMFEMYPDGKQDDTHFSSDGATVMAKLAADGLRELNVPLTAFLTECD